MFLIREHLPGGGKMKRNAVAVAVGALFIAPAAQAQIVFGNDTIGTVQFYGKLYPEVIYAKSSSATQPGESVSTLAATGGVLGGTPPIMTADRRLGVGSPHSTLGFSRESQLVI